MPITTKEEFLARVKEGKELKNAEFLNFEIANQEARNGRLKGSLFEKVYFEEVDLQGVDLRTSKIINSTFLRCQLRRSLLRTLRIEESVFDHTLMDQSDMEGIKASKSSLKGISLRRCNLVGAEFTDSLMDSGIFQWANLQNALFYRCNLAKADLSEASLQNCKFEKCNLSNALFVASDLRTTIFLDVKLNNTIFSGANLEGLKFDGMDLQGADFEGANLKGTSFRSANLAGAKFKNADLTGANFEKANLENSYLKGANFYNTNLSEANLKEAYIIGAKMEECLLEKANFNGALFKESTIKNVVFSNSNLANANFEGAKLQKVSLLPAKNLFLAKWPKASETVFSHPKFKNKLQEEFEQFATDAQQKAKNGDFEQFSAFLSDLKKVFENMKNIIEPAVILNQFRQLAEFYQTKLINYALNEEAIELEECKIRLKKIMDLYRQLADQDLILAEKITRETSHLKFVFFEDKIELNRLINLFSVVNNLYKNLTELMGVEIGSGNKLFSLKPLFLSSFLPSPWQVILEGDKFALIIISLFFLRAFQKITETSISNLTAELKELKQEWKKEVLSDPDRPEITKKELFYKENLKKLNEKLFSMQSTSKMLSTVYESLMKNAIDWGMIKDTDKIKIETLFDKSPFSKQVIEITKNSLCDRIILEVQDKEILNLDLSPLID